MSGRTAEQAVLTVLRGQQVARRSTTVANLAGISIGRTREALGQLERVHLAERDPQTGAWSATRMPDGGMPR